MESIEALDVYKRELGADPSPMFKLKELLLIPWPADLEEYFSNCLPDRSFGRMIRFHCPTTILSENTECVPGLDAIKQGFLCLAGAGDGSQYAYHLPSRTIHLLDTHVYDTEAETLKSSYEHWDSLEEFLSYYEAELGAFHSSQSILERFSDWRTRIFKQI